MKIPLSWIKEFISIDMSAEEMGKELTRMGIEVDGIEEVQPLFEGVVVGKVLKASKHPNADKLQTAIVTDGQSEYAIVCGAPNCREGLLTALAKVGAVLKSGEPFTIKEAKIRGEASFGMLCSAKELGLSEEAEGILEFDESYPLGADLASLLSDKVFELSLTPNLGHCQSVIGIARELSSALNHPLKLKKIESATLPSKVSVSIESKRCKRYASVVIDGVKVQSSPLWMQRRLLLSGLRPINLIVDVTNYVMLETGQPLHAFDLMAIGDQIAIRQAHSNESMTTLDGKKRDLIEDDLVIASKDSILALAGVMGGEASQVTEATTSILLEGAIFDKSSVRKSAKRLALLSDASKRFEKGVDEETLLQALFQAADLIKSLGSGTITSFTDVVSEPFKRKVIPFRILALNNLLGTSFSKERVEEFLVRLGLKSQFANDTFQVEIPGFRHDLNQEVDLIEDVAKLFGYEKFKGKPFSYTPSQVSSTPLFLFERGVRSQLIALGLQEFLTCDLIGPKLMGQAAEALMPKERTVVVQNPVSIEQSVLRTSLMPGLLNVVKHNVDRGSEQVLGFEIGRIHFKDSEEYFEQSQVGLVLSGPSELHHYSTKKREVDFYDLKGILESFFKTFHFETVEFKSSNLKAFHPGRQLAIFVKGVEVGAFGEVHPKILRAFGLVDRVYYAEINLNDLLQLQNKSELMKPIVPFPASDRDFTITLPKTFPVERLFKEARELKSPLLEKVQLQDIYSSPSLGDKHNVTLRFVYRDKEKTVLQEDVDREHQKIINHLESVQQLC